MVCHKNQTHKLQKKTAYFIGWGTMNQQDSCLLCSAFQTWGGDIKIFMFPQILDYFDYFELHNISKKGSQSEELENRRNKGNLAEVAKDQEEWLGMEEDFIQQLNSLLLMMVKYDRSDPLAFEFTYLERYTIISQVGIVWKDTLLRYPIN